MTKVSVVVIGSGVIGLTTALGLQRTRRYAVTIVAREIVSSQSYHEQNWASPFAGADWRPYAELADIQQRAAEEETYFKLRDIATNIPDAGVKHMRIYDFGTMSDDPPPTFLGYVTNVNTVESKYWPAGAAFGYTYDSLVINVLQYLQWLTSEFIKLGGKIKQAELLDIHDAVRYAEHKPCNMVVNCSGMGSRLIRGIYDSSMFPTRGQTLLVHAPAVDFIVQSPGPNKSKVAYVIPRGDGTVILGGVFEQRSSNKKENPQTTTEILRSCLALCPQLLSETPNAQQFVGFSNNVTGNDIAKLRQRIISVNVGFRPSRVNGPRLQKEQIGQLTVVHNYGHSSFGYQTSWGYASSTIRLIDACNQAKL
ncbi:hypothetical protein IWW36_002177 [Coemansia brasiliensis]|uniref:FAD dependent oxidoreductase domain-containing protein n=1 Tax=Coemansia brasiliensis TaxID=2650707 RepID=A0A9W8IA83_9FUNG|nr:hypothetical protein IWW36_002177 [Coemansia brasiliensis]